MGNNSTNSEADLMRGGGRKGTLSTAPTPLTPNFISLNLSAAQRLTPNPFMKGIILAAGKGTRIQPLTYRMPKPMLPIINKPVMEFLVRLLARHGVRQLMVNTSYKAAAIEEYFRDGSNFGVEMAYSFEGQLIDGQLRDEAVGSAGALRQIQERAGFFDSTFIVVCGDAVLNLDLTRLIEFHRRKGGIATLALAEVPRNQVSRYGVVELDAEDRIRRFQEKPALAEARSTLVNAGVYLFEPDVLDYIPAQGAYDIGGQLLPNLVDAGCALYGASLPLQWLDVGTPTDFYRVTQMALRGELPGVLMPGRERAAGIWTGLNVAIDLERCTVVPPVLLGGSSTIEPGATIIGPSLISPGCLVESGAHIERSVVFDYTRIGAPANLQEVIVCGPYCVQASGGVVDLEKSAIDWVIADARSPKKAASPEQQWFAEMLDQALQESSLRQDSEDLYVR